MNQGYYQGSSGGYSSTNFPDSKFLKPESLNARVKPRQSEPPITISDRKPYSQTPKYGKDKQLNISQPFTPNAYSSSNSYKDQVDGGNKSSTGAKNYVNPFNNYPQVSVQPRLSKTLQYEQGSKRCNTQGVQMGSFSQPQCLPKSDLPAKRTLNGSSTPTAGEEHVRRIPRISETGLFSNQEVHSNYNYDTRSHSKGSSYTSSNVSDTTSGVALPSRSLQQQKYPSTSKLSDYSYNQTSSSTLSNQRLSRNPTIEFTINDFVKGKELGAGKFGTVYAAKHKHTGFVCAIKEIGKSIIREENIINQFIRQLKIQSCLNHPNIVRLYGFFHDKNNIYLILQLGSQGQLYKVIKQKKKLSEPTVSFIVRQLCQAVKYLHNLNVIHRDIKPENIVLQYGTVKICDFGWSVCRSGQLRSTFCGTPLYVSPEILKGEMYDEKIDIWALGIMTYQLLVGDTPFQIFSEEELVKIIKEDITFPSDVTISPEAKDFILKILRKNPDERMKIAKLIEHPFLVKAVEGLELDI